MVWVLYICYIFNIFKKYCCDADPDPAQNLDADPDPDPEGGGRSAKNVHPPWQNPRFAPDYNTFKIFEKRLSKIKLNQLKKNLNKKEIFFFMFIIFRRQYELNQSCSYTEQSIR